jgi:hypothetical protein
MFWIRLPWLAALPPAYPLVFVSVRAVIAPPIEIGVVSREPAVTGKFSAIELKTRGFVLGISPLSPCSFEAAWKTSCAIVEYPGDAAFSVVTSGYLFK